MSDDPAPATAIDLVAAMVLWRLILGEAHSYKCLVRSSSRFLHRLILSGFDPARLNLRWNQLEMADFNEDFCFLLAY